MGNRNPSRLGDLLRGAGQRLGIPDIADSGRIRARWSELVGPDISSHVEPTSLREGVLRIRAESSIWATEIGYHVDEIRTRINTALSRQVVTEVRVFTGPGGSPRARSSGGQPEPPRSWEPTERTSEDPGDALERAHKAWVKRRSGGFRRGPPEGPQNHQKSR